MKPIAMFAGAALLCAMAAAQVRRGTLQTPPPKPPQSVYRTYSPMPRSTNTGDVRLGELDWRIIPSQSDMLIGIDMDSIMHSELVAAVIRDWTTELGIPQMEQESLSATLGSVSQVVISIQGKQIIIAMIGRLDDLQEALNSARSRWRGYPPTPSSSAIPGISSGFGIGSTSAWRTRRR